MEESHHNWTNAVLEKKSEAEEQETEKGEAEKKQSGKKRKPLWAVLVCNLFLSLTVVFFQPLIHLLVNDQAFGLLVLDIWWIQLLLAIGIAVVLSLIMVALPVKGRRIVTLFSLGLGFSFLVQSLLFNNGWPFDMNTTWEMKVGSVLIWFWIILFVVTTSYYFLEKYDDKAIMFILTAAWLLIVIQAINLTMIGTSIEPPEQEYYYSEEKEHQPYIQSEDSDLLHLQETVMNISMNRGMPFLLKDSFRVDMAMAPETIFQQPEKEPDNEV